MDIILGLASGRGTKQIQTPVQLIEFKATITGDYSSADKIAAFHTKLGGCTLTINKRKNNNEVETVVNARPLDQVLNVDALRSGRYIVIKRNGTTSIDIYAVFDLGNGGSTTADKDNYVEVILDMGATSATSIDVTGWSNDFANGGYLALMAQGLQADSAAEIPVDRADIGIVVPSTLTRLIMKSSEVDQDMSLSDLKQFQRTTDGLCFCDEGLFKESTNWFFFPYSIRSVQAKVTLSAAGSIYIVRAVK